MDPVNAIGLAASIVQLVDFTARLISDAEEIRDSGSTKDVEVLRRTTNDLLTLSTGLSSRSKLVAGVTDHLDKEEQVSIANTIDSSSAELTWASRTSLTLYLTAAK
jgi:hypothetical protein